VISSWLAAFAATSGRTSDRGATLRGQLGEAVAVVAISSLERQAPASEAQPSTQPTNGQQLHMHWDVTVRAHRPHGAA